MPVGDGDVLKMDQRPGALPGTLTSHGGVSAGVWFWSLLLIAGYLPLLIRFGIEQWGRPQYEFFPLMIIAAGQLGWQRFREIPRGQLSAGSKRVTRVLLGSALVLLLGASVLWSGRMAAISALLALAGIAWHLGGRRVLHAMIPSGILLAVTIGLPVGMDEPFLQALRELAVSGSTHVLAWLRVPHLVTGTVIEIPGSRLLVAEACSGINSVMAVFGLTLVLGFWRRRAPGLIGILVIAGIAFVLWGNMVRIAGGVWLKSRYNIDILSGDGHQWASAILFAVAMGLVFDTDRLMGVIEQWNAGLLQAWRKRWTDNPRTQPSKALVPVPLPQKPTPARVTGGLWALALCFALVGGAQLANATTRGGVAYWIGGGSTRSSLRADATFSVPAEVANWHRSEGAQKLIAQPEIVGKQSQAWAYQQGQLTAVVAIDYPFAGYHDLTVCYRNAGWGIQQQAPRPPSPTTGVFTTALVSRASESGYLWYALVDEEGQWMEPPKTGAADRLADRLKHLGRTDWNAPAYQVQVWVQTYAPLTDQQQRELSQLFLTVRQELSQQVVQQLGGK